MNALAWVHTFKFQFRLSHTIFIDTTVDNQQEKNQKKFINKKLSLRINKDKCLDR